MTALLLREFPAKLLRGVAESRIDPIPHGIVEGGSGRRLQERQIFRKLGFTQRVVRKQEPEGGSVAD